MHELSDKNHISKQPSDLSRSLLIGTAVCGSWFILAFFSSIPALLLKVDAGSQLGQGISHSIMLIGGLLIVFGLLPAFLGTYYNTYKTYLGAVGIPFPKEKHYRVVLISFVLVAGTLLTADLVQNGLSGLQEYHASHGIATLQLAVFASLQAAIVEELVFRGIAYSILRTRFPVWVAILLPSIFFGFAHAWWGWSRVAVTVFMGALFALLRWRTDNLWGPMAMHFLINFGFPVPAWSGWLVAMAFTAGLEVTKQFRKAHTARTG